MPIEVIANLGAISLHGIVFTRKVKTAEETIARQVPGVRMVINTLDVRPPEPKPAPMAWALPR